MIIIRERQAHHLQKDNRVAQTKSFLEWFDITQV